MRHLKTVSVRRAQIDGDDGPTDEEIEDFTILFLFRAIIAVFVVAK